VLHTHQNREYNNKVERSFAYRIQSRLEKRQEVEVKSEPVLSAQGIAAAVSAVIMLGLGMAVSLGWVTLAPDQMGAIETFVGALLALAVLVAPQLIAAYWASKKVTPLAAPKTADGETLIPMSAAHAMFAPQPNASSTPIEQQPTSTGKPGDDEYTW
jgi:hypothetical protein